MIYLDYSDVLIKPIISGINSRKDVNLNRFFQFENSEWEGIPIIASNMDGVGTIEMAKILSQYKMMTALTRKPDPDLARFNENDYSWSWISMGAGDDEIKRISSLIQQYPEIKNINIDIANGYISSLADTVTKIRKLFPDKILMAGNVATKDGVYRLAAAGANIIKIGIGPGSVCTTRAMTGVGVPQFSAILECAEAKKTWNLDETKRRGIYICADGGCTNPGDIVKAFVAGADFVMLGGMLAGHKEGGATVDGGIVDFYGSASKESIDKYYTDKNSSSAEGKKVSIPFRGDVSHTIERILAGIRSAMTYTNSAEIKDLVRCEWIRVNSQINNVFGHSKF